MSELSPRQAVALRRAVFRIRLLLGAVAACGSSIAVCVVAVAATETPMAVRERLVFAGLAGMLAYQLWLLEWSALLRRYPGLVAIIELVDRVELRRT